MFLAGGRGWEAQGEGDREGVIRCVSSYFLYIIIYRISSS